MKIFTDLNDTLVNCKFGNLDLAIVKELDKYYPGIFRDAMNELLEIASWEDKVARAFKVLGKYRVSKEDYSCVAEQLVNGNSVKVFEPVIKSLEKVSDVLTGIYIFTGSSQEVADLLTEKKIKPLLPSYVELMVFATQLCEEKGSYTGKLKTLYGFNERKEITRKLKVGDVSVGIGDNYSTVNQGMVREANYGIFLSKKWNTIDRKGNIFYVRPKHLYVAIEQILNESLPVCKWIIKCDLSEAYARETNPRT
ncbi:MAG: hypothetical protein QXQ69_03670 [Candidatus Aenigmatarchaeota archaeon]